MPLYRQNRGALVYGDRQRSPWAQQRPQPVAAEQPPVPLIAAVPERQVETPDLERQALMADLARQVEALSERIGQMEQQARGGSVAAADRLAEVTNRLGEMASRVASIEAHDTAQRQRLERVEAINIRHAGRLDAIEQALGALAVAAEATAGEVAR